MGDEDRETPVSSGQPGASKVCEYCGTAIDTSDWYPVTKERDSTGSLQFYSFCSEDCQNAWLKERSE